ncbi:hypothetical protein HAX54_028338 [Datura stramonium]|uniref:Uncharacterized protein n=1 Tax=Datura stramonium TaxID=4076 RepID=A0ABS8S9K9_DATST|nr:hypothetical protein [Datura stramonium]
MESHNTGKAQARKYKLEEWLKLKTTLTVNLYIIISENAGGMTWSFQLQLKTNSKSITNNLQEDFTYQEAHNEKKGYNMRFRKYKKGCKLTNPFQLEITSYPRYRVVR